MMRGLFNNTLLSALAFAFNALLGIVVVPIIVRSWGLAAYGLIILARIFIPQGLLAIVDLGASEIATQAIARARVNGDWAAASERIGFMLAMACATGCLIGIGIVATIPLWTPLFRVDVAHAGSFEQIIAATGVAAFFLFPALVAEGVVKGFERFAVLRTLEVGSTVAYVLGVLVAAKLGASFAVVGLLYLAALVGRLVLIGIIALRLASEHGLTPRFPRHSAVRKDMARYVWIMTQSRAVGAIQVLSIPPLVGAIFGPRATAVFDLVIRLPRFAKMVLSVVTTSLLPVSVKIDEHGALDRMRRLGRVALVVLPAVTVPPLVGAAILSKPILTLWIGPDIARFWPWMAIMFAVPIAAQYLAFGSVVMLARPRVQAALNRLALVQTVVMAAVALAFMPALEERAFILAHALAAALFLPNQLWILARQLGISPRVVARTLGYQVVIMGTAATLALGTLRASGVDGPTGLAIAFAAWCALVWSIEYALLLTPDNRMELQRMARAVLGFGRRTASY
jgi:O-antigen/teichoic acid export membrane protein